MATLNLPSDIQMAYSEIGMMKASENPSNKYNLANANNSLLSQQKQVLRDINRSLEICFCVTMYNEGWDLLMKTIRGVIENINSIIKNNKNMQSCQFAIFLMADGFNPIKYQDFFQYATKERYNLENKKYRMINLEELKKEELAKFYQFEAENNKPLELRSKKLAFKGDEVSKHLNLGNKSANYILEPNIIHLFQLRGKCDLGVFEYFQASNDRVDKMEDVETDINFYFAIKHLNGGKLDSQFWYFKGFSEYFKPKYCFLIDCGTRPLTRSIEYLYNYMENHNECGGCCGEIQVELSGCDPLVLTQFVEYKFAHMIDKAFESAFGFISVLPGAFSMYKWEAIEGEPLTNYFLGLDKSKLSCFKANMFLAEDRIMCLSIVTQKNRKYYLHYHKTSVAETDPPDSLLSLIKQRRRWINGSNFASFFVIMNFFNVFRTNHSIFHKLIFIIQFIYMLANGVLTFLLPATMLAAFNLVNKATIEQYKYGGTICLIFNVIYLMIVLVILLYSISTDIDKMNVIFKIFTVVLGCFYFLNLAEFYVFIFKNSLQQKMIIEIISTILLLSLYVLPPVLNCFQIRKYFSMIVGFFIYLFMTPLYSIIFVEYAFCNTHDLSWGNRPTTDVEPNQARSKVEKEKEYKVFRANLLIFWIILNVLVYILTVSQESPSLKKVFYIIRALSWVMLVINGLRMICAIIYIFMFYIGQKRIEAKIMKPSNSPNPIP